MQGWICQIWKKNTSLCILMMYNRETKETKDISKWQAKFSPNGVLSTEFIHDTHRLSTRVRLMEKSNVTWFLFLRRKVDTMSSIRISYNDTLTFKKNMLIGWDFLKNPFLKIIITAIKYIFNNFWDKIDVCLVFKGNQEGRMIGLSTRSISLWWYCTVKTDSNTTFSEIWRAIFTAWQIWLPSNATLI